MSKRGKAYEAAAAKIDRDKKYSLAEAVSLVKSSHSAKFDATVDLAVPATVDLARSCSDSAMLSGIHCVNHSLITWAMVGYL